MNLIKHTDYIYEYQDFISSETCDKIIDLINFIPAKSLFHYDKNLIRYNIAVDLSSSRALHPNIKMVDDISHDIFSKVHHQYLQDCKLISFILQRHHYFDMRSIYVYRQYSKNDFYDWHIDDYKTRTNLISYVVYLNDDFEGGKTLFLNDRLSVKPKKGTILCFPCGLQWIHKSTKIKSGNKQILCTNFFAEEKGNV